MRNTVIKKYPVSEEVIRVGRLLSLAGGSTRIRILCLMFRYKEACVGEIAESLGMSVAGISSHLLKMRDNGFFTTIRDGSNMCYKLVENRFSNELKKIICDNCRD